MLETLQKIGNKNTCPVILLFFGDKLLIGLRNYTSDKWKNISVWTVPGGRCDEGETIEETLRRETYEETGIKGFSIDKYLGQAPGAKEGDTVEIFMGKTNQEPKLMEPEKFSEWKFVKINDIPENFINIKVLETLKKFYSK